MIIWIPYNMYGNPKTPSITEEYGKAFPNNTA